MDAKTKPAWMSKTYAANLLLASAVELHPSVGAWIGTHPQTAVLICAAVNILLRALTTEALHYGVKK